MTSAVARHLLAELAHIAATWPTATVIERMWDDDGLHVRVIANTGSGTKLVDQRTLALP